MPRPSEIFPIVAILMNDSAQTNYTNTAILPMFNLALDVLQENFELNGLPITKRTTSAPITIKAGVGRLGFDTTPALPADLIDIQQLWESPSGLNIWTEMVQKDFLPHYDEDGTQLSQFLIWAWESQRIILIPANQDNDLKIDYIGNIFGTPILIANIEVNLPFTNIKTYLEFETAAMCALFIAENPSRAQELDTLAGQAISRTMGIQVKGMQSTVVRRRPFRYSYKRRGTAY